MESNHTDVIVVGAGIIGLAHAATAFWHEKSVRVLERDAQAVGASVRNFGHVCSTAQSRDMQPLAQASRSGWLRAAHEAGLTALECGAVVVARTATQMKVLHELAEERGEQVQPLAPAEVRTRLSGLGAQDVVGGAFLRDDLRVDPRSAVGELATWLSNQTGVDIRFRHNVTSFAPQGGSWLVTSSRGRFTADEVFVCIGHDVDYLFPGIADERGVERCRLSMGRVAARPEARVSPAVLTGTSMARYSAFVEQPSAPQLLEELRVEKSQLLDVDANVMSTQLPDGSFLVGDTHDSAVAAPPFMAEPGYTDVVDEWATTLAVEDVSVIERWQGVYATSSQQDVLRASPAPGLEVITVTSGIGMTLSFGIAAQSFDPSI